MQASREMLKDRLERYEQELRELHSFLQELDTTTAKYNTPSEQVEEDIREANHNIKFYEGEIAEIKKMLWKPSWRLPHSREQLLETVVITSISFVTGVLLGTTLGGKRKN
jgi:chromosome segregation ATPase